MIHGDWVRICKATVDIFGIHLEKKIIAEEKKSLRTVGTTPKI
jgi:hypothetical protein